MTTKTKEKTKDKSANIEFPNAAPPSTLKRGQPKSKPPTTLRVCGNTIPVRDGKVGESDPTILRERKNAELSRRGKKTGKPYDPDETRI